MKKKLLPSPKLSKEPGAIASEFFGHLTLIAHFLFFYISYLAAGIFAALSVSLFLEDAKGGLGMFIGMSAIALLCMFWRLWLNRERELVLTKIACMSYAIIGLLITWPGILALHVFALKDLVLLEESLVLLVGVCIVGTIILISQFVDFPILPNRPDLETLQ